MQRYSGLMAGPVLQFVIGVKRLAQLVAINNNRAGRTQTMRNITGRVSVSVAKSGYICKAILEKDYARRDPFTNLVVRRPQFEKGL